MKIVSINIDRPIGYVDSFNNVYKINYGHVKGLLAEDNEEQDVYVLGFNKPIKYFKGKILAVIKREDDNEDKWVSSLNYVSKYRIKKDTEFIEKYFKTKIKMKLDFIDFFEGEISIDNVISKFINFLQVDASDLFLSEFNKDTIVITFESKNKERIKSYFKELSSKRIRVSFDKNTIKIVFNFDVDKIICNIYMKEKLLVL